MLQIMRKPPDRLDILLGRQILLMLAFQLSVDGRQLGARLMRIDPVPRLCKYCTVDTSIRQCGPLPGSINHADKP